MSLTDLLKGVQRLARPFALGLAVYGCGDTYNYYGNGGNGSSQGAFCQELCSDNYMGCAEDFHLPRSSECFGACEHLFQSCSMETINGAYDCLRNYDCDTQSSQWFSCLDSVEGLESCAGD